MISIATIHYPGGNELAHEANHNHKELSVSVIKPWEGLFVIKLIFYKKILLNEDQLISLSIYLT